MVACLPSSKKPPTPCLRNCKEEPSHPSKKPRTKQAGWLTLVPISWNPFDLVPLCRKTLVMGLLQDFSLGKMSGVQVPQLELIILDLDRSFGHPK